MLALKNRRHFAYLALLTNAAIWGSSLPIIKPALNHIDSFHYLFFRYLIAAPLSLPILIFLLVKHKPKTKTLFTILGIETIQALGLLMLFSGLRLTTAIQASFITSASPLFTTLGGVLLLKEKEEKHEIVGLAVALAGITLVTASPLINGQSNLGQASLLGNLLVLGFTISFAILSILIKKYYTHVPKLLAASINFWLSLILFFTITYTVQGFPADLINTILAPITIPAVTIASLYMGILGSVIALPALIIGYQLIEVSEASLFTYLQPLFYIPLAVLWLHEPFTPLMAIALIFIATGVFIAERRTRSHLPEPTN